MNIPQIGSQMYRYGIHQNENPEKIPSSAIYTYNGINARVLYVSVVAAIISPRGWTFIMNCNPTLDRSIIALIEAKIAMS